MKLNAFLHRVHWKIAGVFYSVAWCSRIQDKDDLGYCDDVARILYMKDGEPIEETFKTLIHEQVHAMDHVYNIKLSHTQVRKLELALSDFLRQNQIVK